MPANVDFTFLVCTYNRADDLADLLESAIRQDTGGFDYEIVVVDNNSHDHTAATVKRLQTSFPERLKYVFEGRQGKSYALNTGLTHLNGRFYIIADDDLVFPKNYLSTIYGHLQADPNISFLGGKVLPLWRGECPAWLTSRHWSALAMTDYGETEFRADINNPICLLAAVYRTADVREVNGYDVRLGVSKNVVGGVEDAEIFKRLFRASKYGVYAPDVFLYHKVEPERLTKAYHRKWHMGHGRQTAMLRDPAVEQSRGRLFDVPLHLYRTAMHHLLHWARHMISGRFDTAFYDETRLWWFYGFVARRWSDWRRS